MSESTQSHEKDLERFKHRLSSESELLRATAAFEHALLKPAYLLNGGALVVFLALYGAIVTTKYAGVAIDHGLARWDMVAWVAGLLFAVFATASSYRSQFAFLKSARRRLDADMERDNGHESEAGKKEGEAQCRDKQGQKWREWGIGLWGVNIVFFVLGVGLAWCSLHTITI